MGGEPYDINRYQQRRLGESMSKEAATALMRQEVADRVKAEALELEADEEFEREQEALDLLPDE